VLNNEIKKKLKNGHFHGAGYEKTRNALVGITHRKKMSFSINVKQRVMNYLIESGNEPQHLTDAQMQLLNFILNKSEAAELVNGLKTVSEIAIYESERPIDTKEKLALSSVKIFKDMLSEILI